MPVTAHLIPSPDVLVAHGLAVQAEDLPLSLEVFYWSAGVVLVVSFALLAGLWRTPRWSADAHSGRGGARPAPRLLSWVSTAPWVQGTLAALSIAWLAVTVWTALFGSTEAGANPAPNLVFVLGWLGIAVAAALLGRGALHLHPIGAMARLGGFDDAAHSDGGSPGSAARSLHPRVGVWPAFAGLLVFTWLELVYPTSAEVRLLGVLVLVWAVFTLAACSRWGVRTWLERGDPFGAYITLLAALAPWEQREDGSLGWRIPFSGAARDVAARPGLVPLVTMLIGTVSYDGLSRSGWWRARVIDATTRLGEHGIDPDAARQLFGTFGIVMLFLLAWAAFELASRASATIGRLQVSRRGTGRAAQAFAGSLLPIALGYVVAHYFGFFVVQVQDLPRLLADPLDRGWNPFGLADRTLLDYVRPAGWVVWCVQVGAIVVGHVVGLLLAHDRALEVAPRRPDGTSDHRRATMSQVPMLALMLLYTIGGLFFLSEGLTT